MWFISLSRIVLQIFTHPFLTSCGYLRGTWRLARASWECFLDVLAPWFSKAGVRTLFFGNLPSWSMQLRIKMEKRGLAMLTKTTAWYSANPFHAARHFLDPWESMCRAIWISAGLSFSGFIWEYEEYELWEAMVRAGVHGEEEGLDWWGSWIPCTNAQWSIIALTAILSKVSFAVTYCDPCSIGWYREKIHKGSQSKFSGARNEINGTMDGRQ